MNFKVRISFVLFAAVLFFSNSVLASGVLSVVKKEAWLIKEGEEDKKARRGMKIEVGQRVRTGKESYVKITMADKNLLHVGPETEMELKAYDSDNAGVKESIINVVYGRVRSALEKKYDGKASRFRVTTSASTLGVRGTDFMAIHSLDTLTTQAVVFESQIAAQGVTGQGQPIGDVLVSGGEMTTIVQGQAPTPPVKIPPATLNNYNTISLTPQVLVIAAAAAVAPPIGGGLGAIGGGDDSSADGNAAVAGEEDKKEEEKKEEKPKEEGKKEEKKEEPAKPEQSQESDSESLPWSVALKAGTTGASVEVAYPLTKNFNVKVDVYNTFKYSLSGGAEDFYNNEIDFKGIGLLGEWGTQGAFQWVFGAYFTQNKINVTGTPLGNETIGATSYNFGAGDTVVGDGEFSNSIAPYLGIGWKLGILGLFTFVGDIGAMYVGELEVNTLEYSGPANVSDADEVLEAQEIEDEVNQYKVYPVVRVGLSFSF